MNKEQVVLLMKTSKSEQEWDSNCDKVKKSHSGDYPDFWYSAIILSGVMGMVSSQWDS